MSEYEKLVKYLENEQSKFKRSNDDIVQVFTVENDTKKLIEESLEDLHCDVGLPPSNISSRGFDVDRFESLMRARLIDEYKKIQSYERPYISVTELLSCIRNCYYSRLKYPVDLKKQYNFSYLYLINKVGTVVHDLIQELYDFSEVEKTLVSDKFRVKGRLDAIKENNLIELKTIDSDKFQNKYIDKHYFQGVIYAYILNNEYNYNIDTITIVYIIRNLKRIVPFDLEINDKLALSFLNRSKVLLNHISTKTVPDPIGATEEDCKWCSYRKFCEKDKCKDVIQPFGVKENQNRKRVFML